MQNMREISAALAVMPPRFHVSPVPITGSVALSTLMSDSASLGRLLDEDAQAVGASDPQTAASMLVQHVAMVLGGSMLAAALLHNALPVATAEQIGVAAGDRGTRWRFSVSSEEIEFGDAETLLARWESIWSEGILGDLVDAVHSQVKVGRRMLTDNVASAAAGNLVFLDWWAPDRDFAALAEHLGALGEPSIGAAVSFSTMTHNGRVGLRSSRRSCCLHDRCDPPHWCPTCPRLDDAERDTIMRSHLGHLDAVVAARRS